MAQANFENTGSRFQQWAEDFALDNKAQITRINPVVKEINGVTKVYFEVTFKEGRTYWPFNFFCKNLPTDEDIKKLKDPATRPTNLFLQWGRKGEMVDGKFVPTEGWGKPKVVSLMTNDEAWNLQGDPDEYQGDEAETV